MGKGQITTEQVGGVKIVADPLALSERRCGAWVWPFWVAQLEAGAEEPPLPHPWEATEGHGFGNSQIRTHDWKKLEKAWAL